MDMNKKTLSITAAFIILALVSFAGIKQWQGSKGAYPVGSCFKDRAMKIKFKVLKITSDAYEIEVINPGHYTQSPDYFKGNVLLYSKAEVDTQKEKYHPAICEELSEREDPTE